MKRIVSLLALLLGFIGLIACIAAIIGTWTFNARLRQTTTNAFGKFDGSLLFVRERIAQAQERIEASKITGEAIEESLKDWTRREAGERLKLRLDVAERTQRLATTLQQADHWLEVSQSSVELVQQGLSLVSPSGAPRDTTLLGGLIEEIASLRIQLEEVMEIVAGIHQRTAEVGEESSAEDRIEQAAQLALRVVATLGIVDSRLASFENRLLETRTNLKGLETKVLRWVTAATLGIDLLLLWMGAGQVALCLLAWSSLRRTAYVE